MVAAGRAFHLLVVHRPECRHLVVVVGRASHLLVAHHPGCRCLVLPVIAIPALVTSHRLEHPIHNRLASLPMRHPLVHLPRMARPAHPLQGQGTPVRVAILVRLPMARHPIRAREATARHLASLEYRRLLVVIWAARLLPEVRLDTVFPPDIPRTVCHPVHLVHQDPMGCLLDRPAMALLRPVLDTLGKDTLGRDTEGGIRASRKAMETRINMEEVGSEK